MRFLYLFRIGIYAVIMIVPLLGQIVGASVTNQSILFSVNADYIEKLITKHDNATNIYLVMLRRNGISDRLIANYLADNIPRTAAIFEDRIDIQDAPAKCTYYDDNGKIIAWYDNLEDGIRFSNGDKISGNYFRVDPSGRYFTIDQGRTSWIGKTDNPSRSLRPLTTNILIKGGVYTTDDKIIAFGVTEPVSVESSLQLLYIHESNGVFTISHSQEIPWGGRVFDVDFCSNKILLKNRSDFWPVTYIYHADTGKRDRLLINRQYSFFMRWKKKRH